MESKNVEHTYVMFICFGVHKQEVIPCIDHRRVEWKCQLLGFACERIMFSLFGPSLTQDFWALLYIYVYVLNCIWYHIGSVFIKKKKNYKFITNSLPWLIFI